MGLVRKVVSDVVTPNRGAFLSFGLLGTLWTASGGFSAAIEALNIAYDVEETRPFWKTRPMAVGLTFLIGLLLLAALSIMIVGPRFGEWLSYRAHLTQLWVWIWPYIHWTLAIGFTVLAVEALYFLARCSSVGWLLDWALVSARDLFPQLRQFQQDIWHTRGGCGVDGVAVLDRICDADRRRIECRAGEAHTGGPRRTAARATDHYEIGLVGLAPYHTGEIRAALPLNE
jgi:hypothetical protein